MQPFNTTAISSDHFFSYLTPYDFIELAEKLNSDELKSLVRSRFLENIPFSFKHKPLIYETMRAWVAREIKINPSEIVVIGSAKLGFSPTAHPNFGKKFGDDSDLDLTAISEKLFNELNNDLETWINDIKSARITPRNTTENNHWQSSQITLPKNAREGFLDPYKIPNRYTTAQLINQKMWALNERLKASDPDLNFKKCSMRVYKNWDAFTKQLMTNLNYALSTLPNQHKTLLLARENTEKPNLA
ncbi:hypothetical protein H3221_003775 [Pseudomonas sp. LMG 31766]|uniref:Nucleotidyltransferase n=1 Tax=Pseudomonas chaetocerotis TaxID=2758695 RepID=A0A931D210_9PSED|nr:hypothetical protein [Pseudomonas chaetocerotis]MBZ9663867.1 hypothetical protein [Pseudomonas chaetocerotis]